MKPRGTSVQRLTKLVAGRSPAAERRAPGVSRASSDERAPAHLPSLRRYSQYAASSELSTRLHGGGYASGADSTTAQLSANGVARTRSLLQDVESSIVDAPFPVDTSVHEQIIKTRRARASFESKATVVICGDVRSGVEDLVTVLLDDPLASDPEVGRVIRERRKLVDKHRLAIRIQWGSSATIDASAGVISIPLTWLKTNNFSILEVLHPFSPSAADILARSTVPVLLVDDVRLTNPSLAPLLTALGHHPNSSVLVNRITKSRMSSSSHVNDDTYLAAATMQLRSSLAKLLARESGLQIPETLCVDTTQALDALRNFSSSSPSSSLPTYAMSGLTDLRARLDSLLSSPERSSAAEDAIVSRTTATLTQVWLRAMADMIDAEAVLEEFRGRIRDLKADARRVLDDGVRGVQRAKGKEPDVAAGGVGSVGGKEDTEKVLHTCLKWWKLPWKVDDVGWYIRSAVDSSYGKDLNQRLAFTSGILSGTSDQASALVTALLSHRLFASSASSSKTAFPTALLANKISQQIPSPSLFNPSLLTNPIAQRKAQLLSRGGPIDLLHRRAQLLLAEATGIGGGTTLIAGMGWTAAWWEAATAVGLGGLGWAAAGWRMQGRWKRGQRRFWREWDRVERGLREDLKASAEALLSDRIFLAPTTALTSLATATRSQRAALESYRADRLGPLAHALQERQKGQKAERDRGQGRVVDLAFGRESLDQGFGRDMQFSPPPSSPPSTGSSASP